MVGIAHAQPSTEISIQ